MEPRERACWVARGASPRREPFADAATERDGARELVVDEAAERCQHAGGAQQRAVGKGGAWHAPRSPRRAPAVNAGAVAGRRGDIASLKSRSRPMSHLERRR